MAAVRAGDDGAFEVLYGRYSGPIGAYVRGMVRDHGRAEDVTQEVFVSALRRMRASEQAIVFRPWIYEIAKNACIDAYRRSRRGAHEVSYDSDGALGTRERLVSTVPTPDAAVDARAKLDHLRGAFDGLSETHHRILVLRELEGLSYDEIGRRMELSRPAVESTLFRARRRLGAEYAEIASGRRCEQVRTLIEVSDPARLRARDERVLARHVSHCQGCRRDAALAGVDLAALAARRTLRGKIAALLPLPLLTRPGWLGGARGDAAATAAVGRPSAALARWASTLSLHGDQASQGWSKAAAVVATVAAVGAGAGAATHPEALGLGGDAGGPRPAASATAGAGSAADGDVGTSGAATSAEASAGADAASEQSTGADRPAGSGAGGADDATAAAGGGGDGGAGTADAISQVAAAAGGSGSGSGMVGATVGGVTGSLGSTVADVGSGAAGAAQQTVDGATETVDRTVQGVTDAVDGVVDQATGPGTGAVDEVVQGATGTVTGVTTTATNTADGATETVTGAVSGATGAVGGLLGRR